eukprot:1139987-Pelagomonas_calceolata.AAC.1
MEIMRCCTAKNPHHRQQQQVASDVGGSSSGVQLKSACLLLEIELGDQGSSVQLLPSRVTPLCKGERKQSERKGSHQSNRVPACGGQLTKLVAEAYMCP